MKKYLALVTLFFMLIVIPLYNVDAAPRGKSFSSSPASSPNYSKSNQSINKNQESSAPGSAAKSVRNTSSQRPGWLGWLPFIGLGMMMGHFGIGSIFSILSSILVVVLVIFLVKKFINGRTRY